MRQRGAVLFLQRSKETKVGIGFATGRNGFQQVLRTCVYNWNESGLVENDLFTLNLFIAYDLNYNQTIASDYTDIHQDLVDQLDSINFIDSVSITREIDYLISENVLDFREAELIFGDGYASKRNAIVYNAIKANVDYLIFLDDDEYPLAVTNTANSAIWGGQHVLPIHLKYIRTADITHSHHCGYISPIPYVEFNSIMQEKDFRAFIEAISNDIINWENVMKVMGNGGVTYADTNILTRYHAVEISEVEHTKFISGANLCLNLTDPLRVLPFYNPPGARGEDTFLSTCLGERTVLSVPCYTFHDGFSTYSRLLEGVLPSKLKTTNVDNAQVVERFYNACIGWIRYKPLLLYITQPDRYEKTIREMREKLEAVLPKVCRYFREPKFAEILPELDKYYNRIEEDAHAFLETQAVWSKIMEHFKQQRRR